MQTDEEPITLLKFSQADSSSDLLSFGTPVHTVRMTELSPLRVLAHINKQKFQDIKKKKGEREKIINNYKRSLSQKLILGAKRFI